MHSITLRVGDVRLDAELNDTGTATSIHRALPLEGRGRFWGDEIYFPVPVSEENEAPTTDLSVGDLAYWPGGDAFCIFFGPTPASEGEAPRPASPVTVVGRVTGEVTVLADVDRPDVRVEAAEN